MHVSFALFADAANISQEGKLNILGVFDALQVAAVPAVHPRATLVVRLKAHAEAMYMCHEEAGYEHLAECESYRRDYPKEPK